MAAITKSAVQTKSRGRTPLLWVIIAVLCFGTIQGLLAFNRDYLSDSPERYKESSLLSIEIKNKPKQATIRKLSFPKSNEEYFRNPSVKLPKRIYMFHHTISTPEGTEGTVIRDMLLGHAYAYHQGGIYGGSCGDGNDVLRGPENSLLEAIGLQDFLQFACPRDIETSDRKKTVSSKVYTSDGTRAFTPEYTDLLKAVMRYPQKPESQKNTNTIVVHISRGKRFTPCKKKPYKKFQPYLPNKHYQVSSRITRKYTNIENRLFLTNLLLSQ